MEATGFKKRLMEAKRRKEHLKLIFQYPNSRRAIVKRGYVLACANDAFQFQEIYDGVVDYAYTYLVEIKPEIELKGGSEANEL